MAAIAFVALFVPEPKGMTLEEIEFNLKSSVRLRELGNRSAEGRRHAKAAQK